MYSVLTAVYPADGENVYNPGATGCAIAAPATTIVAAGYWCGTTPPTTRPGTSHARAALWSSDSGWISEPTPGVGPAWTRPANPLASITGLFMA
jgi:hypothetical protein